MTKRIGKSIYNIKVIIKGGVIVEMKIWKVPSSLKYPSGYKYSLYAILNGEVLVGYDNHFPKGHHRHIGAIEEVYEFINVEQLRNDFVSTLEVEMIKVGI